MLIKETTAVDVAVIDQVSLNEQASLALAAAEQRAADIVTQAEQTAASILEQAEAAAIKQQQAGYDAGHLSGFTAGTQAAQAEFERQTADLQTLRQQLVLKDRKLLEEAQSEIVEMALLVASRVIGQHLRSDDQAVQASLRQVMNAALGARSALLQVSAGDFDHLWAKRQEWAASVPGLREFNIETNASLQKGDLLLQCNQGAIDARVETILEQVAEQLGEGVGF